MLALCRFVSEKIAIGDVKNRAHADWSSMCRTLTGGGDDAGPFLMKRLTCESHILRSLWASYNNNQTPQDGLSKPQIPIAFHYSNL